MNDCHFVRLPDACPRRDQVDWERPVRAHLIRPNLPQKTSAMSPNRTPPFSKQLFKHSYEKVSVEIGDDFDNLLGAHFHGPAVNLIVLNAGSRAS